MIYLTLEQIILNQQKINLDFKD